jgi:hypothetical protein
MIEIITEAYEIVKNFKRFDTASNPPKKHTLEYSVPKISGISKYEWGKNIDEVKPNTLDYIIYKLHSTEELLIQEAVMALLYYWKIRRRNIKKMEDVYLQIMHHYSVKPMNVEQDFPDDNKIYVYHISWSIGSKRVYKVGYTTEFEKRVVSIANEVKRFYPLVNLGDLKIHRIIEFNTTEQAQSFEEEAKRSIENAEFVTKSKFYFTGSSESYIYS